jgi:hypothetical protein
VDALDLNRRRVCRRDRHISLTLKANSLSTASTVPRLRSGAEESVKASLTRIS